MTTTANANPIIDLPAGTRIEYNDRTYTLTDDCIDEHNDRAIALVVGPTGVAQPLFVWLKNGSLAYAATQAGPWAPAKIVDG